MPSVASAVVPASVTGLASAASVMEATSLVEAASDASNTSLVGPALAEPAALGTSSRVKEASSGLVMGAPSVMRVSFKT